MTGFLPGDAVEYRNPHPEAGEVPINSTVVRVFDDDTYLIQFDPSDPPLSQIAQDIIDKGDVDTGMLVARLADELDVQEPKRVEGSTLTLRHPS